MAIPKEVQPDADVIWRIQLFNKSIHQGKEATYSSKTSEKTRYFTRCLNQNEIILKTSITMI